MNIKSFPKYFYVGLLIPALFLPGCGAWDWVKSKLGCSPAGRSVMSSPMTNVAVDDTSEILVTINGKPAVTVKSFERDFDMLMEENPQLKQVLPFMPEARRNFLTGLVNQEIVDMYVRDNTLDQKLEYQQDLERLHRSVVRMLNTKYFQQAHPVNIQDEEVQAYYDANKDKMQELVVSRGGCQTVGIQFEKESEAKTFMTKVQNKNISEVAKTEKMTDKVRDFKLVNKQSVGIDTTLRNKIVTMEKFPTTEMIKVGDKAWWVIQVTSREEAKYRAFEDVKQPLRQVVEREKSNEALQKAVDGLKNDMKVVVNDDYFKRSDNAQQPAMPALAQAPEQAQPQQQATQAVQEAAPQPARAV